MARTFTTPASVRVWESQLGRTGTIWRSNVLGAFVQPFLYLLGMGLGVGALVDNGSELRRAARRAVVLPVPRAWLMATVGDDGVVERGHVAGAARLQMGTQLSRRGGDAAHARSDHDRRVALWQTTKAMITAHRRGAGVGACSPRRARGVSCRPWCSRGSRAIAFSAPLTAWTATRER